MRTIVGVRTTSNDIDVTVIDDGPFVRLELSGSWVQLPPDEAEHIASALSEAAKLARKNKPER